MCSAGSALLLFAVTGFARDGVTHLAGEVFLGQEYRHEIPSGLFLVLSPTDTGWMISVVPKTPCLSKDDWASVVNSPFRGYNSLYLDAAYGITATEAVKTSTRDISFVVTCADYQREVHRLEIVLWPYSYSQQEADAALETLGTSPVGKAKLTILDSKVSRAEQDVEGKNYGKIDWLKFKVDVTFPAPR